MGNLLHCIISIGLYTSFAPLNVSLLHFVENAENKFSGGRNIVLYILIITPLFPEVYHYNTIIAPNC